MALIMINKTSAIKMKSIIAWLIAHTTLSYVLYVSVTCMELVFGIGFFTRKYDNILAGVYIFFLLADT